MLSMPCNNSGDYFDNGGLGHPWWLCSEIRKMLGYEYTGMRGRASMEEPIPSVLEVLLSSCSEVGQIRWKG